MNLSSQSPYEKSTFRAIIRRIELRLRLYAQYGRDEDVGVFMNSLISKQMITPSEMTDYQYYYERYKESMEYGAPGL